MIVSTEQISEKRDQQNVTKADTNHKQKLQTVDMKILGKIISKHLRNKENEIDP